MKILDISLNKITKVKGYCFLSLGNVKMFYLQNNRISIVEDNVFYTMTKLKILNLSQNKIIKLTGKIFTGLHNVEVINLTLNLITDISANAFTFVLPKTVHSLNRQVCSMSGPWQKCKLVNNAFGNCKDLLFNKVIRGIYWFAGTLTLTTNFISILFHITLFSQLQTNKFFTLSLSMVDCLYGLYLLTISMADWYYRGYYEGASCMW